MGAHVVLSVDSTPPHPTGEVHEPRPRMPSDEKPRRYVMANLTAWKFDSPSGASQAVRTLKDLQNEGLIVITSAAIVEWPQGNKKPKTRQIDDMTGREAAGGAFWGFLFGILFFVPLFGAAVGAGIGALHG